MVTLGLTGIAEALAGDEEAMKKLSPSARELVQTLLRLKPAFEGIRSSVQENLFQGLAGPIEQLVTTNLPNLKTLLDGVATSLNTGFTQALASLNSEAGKLRLDKLFESVGKIVGDFSTTFGPLTEAVTAFGAASAEAFAEISPAIAERVNQIAAAITRFADSGDLKQAFQDAWDVGKQLVETIQTIGQVASTIIDPFKEGFTFLLGDGSIQQRLEGIQSFFDRLNEVLSTPTMQKGLESIGKAFAVLQAIFITFAAAIGLIIIGIIGIIGKFTEFIEFIASLPGQISTFFTTITTFITTSVQGWLTSVQTFVTNAILAIASFGANLVNLFISAMVTVQTTVTSGFDQVVGFVAGIPGRISEAVSSVIGLLAGIFNSAMGAVVGAVTGGAAQIIGIFQNLPSFIVSTLSNLASEMFTSGSEIVQGIIDGLESKLSDLRSTVSEVASAVKDYLPFSPAKTGPLSGRGAPKNSGIAITELIAEGLRAGTAQLSRAAAVTVGGLTPAGLTAGITAPTFSPQAASITPAAASITPQATTGASRTFSPNITVTAPNTDPQQVVNLILRRLALAEGF